MIEELKNKKIGILGFGDENRALVRYLLNQGITDITICDRKGEGELKSEMAEFDFANLDWRLGEGYLENLTDFDLVFRTPGLPYFHQKIQEAKRSGVSVSSETKLFFAACPCPIIGVTGTKGKGTTTALIGEILKRKFQNPNSKSQNTKIFVGGNIGTAPVSFLDGLTKDDIVVLELSSFQLQDLTVSPHIAVILDIKSDHLDYHAGQTEYVEAKKMIVEQQTAKDFVVVNADYLTSLEFGLASPSKTYFFSRRKSVDLGAFVEKEKIILRTEEKDYDVIDIGAIKLRGEHNLENICAAVIGAYLAGAEIDSIREAVGDFRGLEHRLELAGNIDGVNYYNDSFSTTPDTTIAAIHAFSEPIILLVGGSEKNADYDELSRELSNANIKAIIAIGETAKRIIEHVEGTDTEIVREIQSMDQAVQRAKSISQTGDVILLSPASASFDHYQSYKDRGEQFKRAVADLGGNFAA